MTRATRREAHPTRQAEGPRIGVDEWVARAGERTGARGGPLRAAPNARAERLPWWLLLALAVGVAALLPFVSELGLRDPRRASTRSSSRCSRSG